MEPNTREIESISFGVYSEEEIIRMSACKLTTENSKAGYGSVYDPRMGTTDFNVPCETCKQKPDKCPGHFGYVEFNMPILHPLHIKEVLSYLRCVCMKCSRPLITEGQVDLDDLKRFKGNSRFTKILLKARKVSVCGHCGNNQPGFELGSVDGSIAMVYLDKNKRVGEDGKSKTEKTKVSIALTVDEIHKILDNVSDEDVRLLGYDPTLVHPRNYIMTTLPILPPADRPYVIADGKTSDDDITIHYCFGGSTAVLMWDGRQKTVRELRVGDTLVGFDFNPVRVEATCTGIDEMYRVDQKMGDSYTVNSKHLLCLKDVTQNQNGRIPNKYVYLSVERYLELDGDERKSLDGYRRVSYSSLSNRDRIYPTGIDVSPIGEGEYYGIQIEGEDKRFLLADCTVVHNCDIIKLNNNLASTSATVENKRQKDYQNLIFKVRTTFNNSGGKAKHSMNNRPIKCIKERLTGKSGRIRNNLSGKRCDQSGRTVIGPDPTLRMDEMALPEEMAKILSIPVKVNKFNYAEMVAIVNAGKANFVRPDGGEVRVNLAWALQKKPTRLQEGDVIVRGELRIPVTTGREMLKENDKILRDGEFLQKVEYGGKRPFKLKLGDIVERQLRDYDPILLNRQPTLHQASMRAMKVRVMPGKTIRFNLAIAGGFNADFDGDEIR